MTDGGQNGRESAGSGVESLTDRLAGDPSQFATLTGNFYRGEVDRMTTWRTRLDQTTNWAVVVMAAILTWAFSSPDNPHYVLLVGMLAVTTFLLIEAQRYQEYDAWRGRVLILQRNFFAALYGSGVVEGDDWRQRLSDDLLEPQLRASIWRAAGLRLQHVYLPLLTVLLAAWALRITVFDATAPWYRTAAIASVPGSAVVVIVGAWYLLFVGVTIWSFYRGTRREFDDDVVAPDRRERR